jgi:hypothetical protein
VEKSDIPNRAKRTAAKASEMPHYIPGIGSAAGYGLDNLKPYRKLPEDATPEEVAETFGWMQARLMDTEVRLRNMIAQCSIFFKEIGDIIAEVDDKVTQQQGGLQVTASDVEELKQRWEALARKVYQQ